MRSDEISLHPQASSMSGMSGESATTVSAFAGVGTPVVAVRGAGRQRRSHPRRAVIVGGGGIGALAARELQRVPKTGAVPVGFVADDPGAVADSLEGLPRLGGLHDLARLADGGEVDLVLVASAPEAASEAVFDKDPAQTERHRQLRVWEHVSDLKLPAHVQVCRVVDYYERSWRKIPSLCLGPEGLTGGADWDASDRGRRAADVVGASLLLLLLAPLMALVALAVKLDSPGPVFYCQRRTGKNGSVFSVYKFRSMRRDAEKVGGPRFAEERDPRITRVGRILRLTRLDELPQFVNVLRGEMSLIGPRPERPEFDEGFAKVIPHYALRYRVKPGITGWAQVMYRYGASEEDAREKLAYDLYYLKHRSALLDLVIALKTIQVVLFGKGR